MNTATLLCFALATVTTFACEVRNPHYCAGAPDNNCANLEDAGKACTSSDQCSAPNAVCDVAGSKTCVQCLAPDQTSACTGTTPTCSDDHACRACTAHSECATSNVCLPDGSCAAENQVAYVSAGGTDNANCAKATPCTKVTKALATNRSHVKFTGTIDEGGIVAIDNQNVSLHADPNAKLVRTSNGVILEVKGTSKVAIYDLEISGASGAGAGISMPTGNTAQLELRRTKVLNNAGGGISASGGTLAVSQSTLSGNQGGGISMATAGVVTLTNNFIHHNGNTTTASFGGLSLRPMGASKIEFNTIVDNQANLGAASAGGVFCDTGGFVAPNNIIFRNTGGTTGNVQAFGLCTYGNSFNMPGTSAVDNSPSFANPNSNPSDYHLTATTPTTILGAAGACTGTDFDGNMRPLGSACDLGADEFNP